MRSIKKIIIIGSLSCLLMACHEEVRHNPMANPKAILVLKKQLFLGGADARTCATAMSDPKHNEINASVCEPWVDKQYEKYKTNIENRNHYLHEKNAVPVRADFNDPTVWKGLLALWKKDQEKILAEEKEAAKRRQKQHLPQVF